QNDRRRTVRMSYLLDSHTFLWALLEQKKLSPKVLDLLQDATHPVFVSSVSFWEISLKFRLGKLDLAGVSPEELPESARESGFDLLPPTPSEAAGYHLLEAEWHRDPFDRMLIRQAITHDLTLLSKDKTISQYRSLGLKVVW